MRLKEAEEHMRAAIAILEKLHEEYPRDAGYGSDLGVAYLNFGRLCSETDAAWTWPSLMS